MRKGWRFRPVGWLVAAGTLAAMSTTLVVAAPGRAATAQKAYTGSAPLECVEGPGILNIKSTATFEMGFKGPESVQEAQSGIEFTEASVAITSPPEVSESYLNIGAQKVRGMLAGLTIDAVNMEPPELIVGKGAPWETLPQRGKPVVVRFPHEGTFSFGLYRVTGRAGQKASLLLDGKPGYQETEPGVYKATGTGFTFTVEGVKENGEHVIGPITVVCNAPSGIVLAEVPIEQATTTTTTCSVVEAPHVSDIEPSEGPLGGGTKVRISGGNFGRVTAVDFGATPASFTINSETAITAISPPGKEGKVLVEVIGPCHATIFSSASFTYTAVERAEYKNWVLSGNITDKKLGQAITLPAGSTMNGVGEVNTIFGEGSVTAHLSVPPFSARLKLFGFLPVSLGMGISEVGSLVGRVLPNETIHAGELILEARDNLDISITSVGLQGLTIPTNCATAEPVPVLSLDFLSREELLRKGWSLASVAKLPSFACEGGFLGRLFGTLLSQLLSGPENTYALKVTAPTT